MASEFPPSPNVSTDFIVQVAATMAEMRTDLKHTVRTVESVKQDMDQWKVEHRSQHYEDRQRLNESLDKFQKDTKSDVNDQVELVKESVRVKVESDRDNRKVFITLGVSIAGLLIVNIIWQIIERAG